MKLSVKTCEGFNVKSFGDTTVIFV